MSGNSCSNQLLQRAFSGLLQPQEVRELIRMELEPQDIRRLERAFLSPAADVVSYCRVFERHNTPRTLEILQEKGRYLQRTMAALSFIYQRLDVFKQVYETNRLKALSGISAALYHGHEVTPERFTLFDDFVRPLLRDYVRARLASRSDLTRDRQAMELVPLAALWPNFPKGRFYLERVYIQAGLLFHIKEWLAHIMLRMETERFTPRLRESLIKDVRLFIDEEPLLLVLALRVADDPVQLLVQGLNKLYWNGPMKSATLQAIEEHGGMEAADVLTRALLHHRNMEIARTLLRLSWKQESALYALFALLAGARPDSSMKADTPVRHYITRLTEAL